MSRLQLSILVVMSMIVTSAVAAGSAAAFTEFTAAEGAKLKVKQKGNLTFEAKAGKVTVSTICTSATGEGVVKGKKTEIGFVPSLAGCTVAGLKANFPNKCEWVLHITGLLDLNGKNCATMELAATKCVMTITGEQKGLKEVIYRNEGGNLIVEMKVTGINFESSSGKNCGFETETVKGTIAVNGALIVEGINVK
jgi:hypothetical protein